jgi:hypothetical protein
MLGGAVMKRGFVLVFAAAMAVPVWAGGFSPGTIVDGGVSLDFDSNGGGKLAPGGGGGCGDKAQPRFAGRTAPSGGGGPGTLAVWGFCVEDLYHLYENLLFFRQPSDGFELPWPLPDSSSYVGNTAQFQWQDVDGRYISAVLTVVLSDDSAGAGTAGTAQFTLELTNHTGMPQTFEFFPYVDFCVNDVCSGMTAVLQSANNWIRVSAGDTTADMRQLGPAAYQVATYSEILDLLTDQSADTLNNTGLPYPGGDYTGAFQQQVVLPARGVGAVTVRWVISINQDAVPVELQGFTID